MEPSATPDLSRIIMIRSRPRRRIPAPTAEAIDGHWPVQPIVDPAPPIVLRPHRIAWTIRGATIR
ncbi:MAG: hypothetical protein R3B96_21240 [Pirellulaceae bacterium]